MTQTGKVPATAAENAAWAMFVLATIVSIIAFINFIAASADYAGNTEGPLAVLTIALPLAGLGLVPALLLAGIRGMLPALAARAGAVHDADAATDDAHDGRGDSARGEHLRGDVREPDTRDA